VDGCQGRREQRGVDAPDASVVPYVFVAAYLSDPWTVLGDPSRRAIIERLSSGACTVAGLAAEMPISRPAVSQHLKVLKDAGVVRDEPSGRHRVYSLDAARLDRYRHQLDRFWSEALGGLARDSREQDRSDHERGAG
jgi:DNA-binding transcriptional ArsR family regulator